MKARVIYFCTVILFLFSWNNVWAEDWLSVPGGPSFCGSPTYISEFESHYRDNGGPLSDLGSHCGIKSEVHDMDLASLRHFAAVTGSHLLDYSRTGLFGISHVELLDASGGKIHFKKREVFFNYFGWQEKASAKGIKAGSAVSFHDTDIYVLEFSVLNTGQQAISFSPVLVFKNHARKSRFELIYGKRIVIERFKVRTGFYPKENYLALAPGFSIKDFDLPGGLLKPGEGKSYRLTGEGIKIRPDEEYKSFVVFAYSADEMEQAQRLALDARDWLEDTGRSAFALAEDRWNTLIQNMPAPHTDNPNYIDLYRMSIAALEMAVYKPRDMMTHWGCVPSKGHYNWFWLWDSGFQSLGYVEKDPGLAQDVILTIFDSQREDGYMAHMTNDKLKRVSPHSQSPVFGYTAQKILPHEPDRERALAFKRRMYEQGRAYIQWWHKARDHDHDNLYEFLSQDEGGWDNSPRSEYVHPILFISYFGMLGELIASRTKPLDTTDLNSWLYLYYVAMSDWAFDLGKESEGMEWKKRADALAERIDQVLWSDECGCWLDAFRRPWQDKHRHFHVLTPHIWFPAWAGATRDEGKARRVIEDHLLNPEEFFGRYPIPTVAYNDRYYDPSIPGWTGDIWPVFSYLALETLFQYGYDDEAEELKKRTLDMMSDQDGMHGIYENYDPRTGLYKDPESTGGYCTFQFGWSAAFTMGMILDRWQYKRFLFDDTPEFSGFVRQAVSFATRERFMELEAARDVPLIDVKSADGLPLLKSQIIRVRLEDPYGSLEKDRFKIKIRGKEFEVELGQEQILLN
jgi:hypothetical protein